MITFYANENDSQQLKLRYLLKVLKEYIGSNYLITNTYTNLDVLASKITGILIHIHYSDEITPIPRKFLEYNGYELLTSAKIYNLSSEECEEHSSLYTLQELGFINIIPSSEGQCREYSLQPLGEAVVGALSLLYKGKYPSQEITLKPGDLTADYKDYQYYIEVEGFYPDTEIVNAFLSTLKTSTINLSTYVKEFSNNYPIIKMSKEEYRSLILNNILDINDNLIQDFSTLRNFDRDINLVTSGINIYSLIQGKFRQKIISYENVWRLSYTGRLFQRQGLQGLSRKSKSVIHKDYINYDIPSCQLNILIQLIEEVYIKYRNQFTEEDLSNYNKLSFLKDYNKNKNSIIEQIGISDREWKECLYSIVFGAKIDNLYNKTKLGSIIFFNKDNPKFHKLLLIDNLLTLTAPVTLWYKYQKTYIQDYRMNPLREAKFLSQFDEDSSLFVFNGLNYIPKQKLLKKTPAKITAYFLQGIESSFILHLMTLLPKNAISYEFDGLVVDKEIHPDIIQEARNKSGFLNGTVIVKPFQT